MKLSCFNNPEKIQNVTAKNFYNILKNPVKNDNFYSRQFYEKLKSNKKLKELQKDNNFNLINANNNTNYHALKTNIPATTKSVSSHLALSSRTRSKGKIINDTKHINTLSDTNTISLNTDQMNAQIENVSFVKTDTSRLKTTSSNANVLSASFFKTKSVDNFANNRSTSKIRDKRGSTISATTNRKESVLKIAKSMAVNSPIAKEFNCEKNSYRTDKDYNDLIDRKILNDVRHIGEHFLNTIAIRRNSPARYEISSRGSIVKNKDKKQSLFSSREKSASNLYIKKEEIPLLTDERLKTETQDQDDQEKELKDKEDNMDITNLKRERDTDQMVDKTSSLSLENDTMNVKDRYAESLNNILDLFEPIFEKLSTKDKINKFILGIEDQRRNIRLGALVALYIMKDKNLIIDDLSYKLIHKIIDALKNFEEQDELFLVACFELLSK